MEGGLGARARAALATYVARADDERVERTVGSRAGLRLLAGVAQAAYSPDPADPLVAVVALELRTVAGRVRPWTLRFDRTGLRARPGRSAEPELTVRVGVADALRIAAGELDPGSALLTGCLDVLGDLALATRLEAMAP